MSVNFFEAPCQSHSKRKLFGLRDDVPGVKAKIDETDGSKWIAVVVNESMYPVTFTAIDNCIEIKREDGKMAKRCDGVLTYNKNLIFVELKERPAKGNAWVIDGEEQLRITIGYFEDTEVAENYIDKKAYIANSEHPKFKESQRRRMDQFLTDTGYVLRIENRIKLE